MDNTEGMYSSMGVPTLKSLINEQGGYVVFLILSEYSFIRDFRVRNLKIRLIHMLCFNGLSID